MVCAICVSVGLHTYVHTYTPQPTYIHTYIHTGRTYMCGLRTYIHRGLYISVWLHARYVNKNCAVPGYYAANSVNFVPTFRETCRSHPQGSRIPPPPQKKTDERSSQLLRGGSPEITHVTHITKRIILWRMCLSISPSMFVSFTRSGVSLCTASPSWFTFQRILLFKLV